MEGPPSSTAPKSNFPMLYYGLIVFAMAVIVLALYNLIIVKWCADLADHRRLPQGISRRQHAGPTFNSSPINLIASFKYEGDGKVQDGGGDSECAVCLSVFEKGEDIRQLPKCKHYFHAPCIDIWLYSHMDCPLCRSPVEPPLLHQPPAAEESEHSREGLLGPSTLV